MIGSIASLYNFGFGLYTFFALILLNKIVLYYVWPIMLFRTLYVAIWFTVGGILGYHLGLFYMYSVAALFSILSLVVQNLFWTHTS